MLCISVCLFLLLSSILLYQYTSLFANFPVDGHLAPFQLLTIKSKAT